MNPIYLDYNATTPIIPEVAEAMRPYLDVYFGNPSSSHTYGIETKKAVEKARKQLGALLNCSSSELIFTSGGTESNNYSLKGFAYAHREKGNHIITSTIEHPAVIEVCRFLETEGFEVTYLPVDETGRVQLEDVEKAIQSNTILISVMFANNEVGTLQPIKEIAALAHAHGIAVHTDCAQAIGKVPVDIEDLGVDMLSVAGHKFYGPKGIGALFIRSGVELQKLMHGADHEQNLRAGTENVLEIVGLGKAAELAHRDLEKTMKHDGLLRERLRKGISDQLEGTFKINGNDTYRLPNTLSISFAGIEANAILSGLEEVAASAGAACHTDSIDVSATLSAMNVPLEYAMGTIRFSTGRYTTEEDIDRAVEAIVRTVKSLQPQAAPPVCEIPESEEVKLTRFTSGLGCACKLRPQALEKALKGLSQSNDPRVLVGNDKADDAAVYRINEELAMVQTCDFFTPIVDDPYRFGQIAAANSLSDIYAMGAKPLYALNVVGFPSNRLPLEVLNRILKGAEDKAAEAGISIIGGHTVDDAEPKFGLVVTGEVHPDRILSNDKACVGDVLILTKPLGLGIIATAGKRGLADEKTLEYAADLMAELNAVAAEVMHNYPVSTCTDVTGFGLLGHLKELTQGSGVEAEIWASSVPVIEAAQEFVTGNVVPGGTLNNMEFVKSIVEYEPEISKTDQTLLCDAQTSGGLLIAVPEEYAESLLNELHCKGISRVAKVGKITSLGSGNIKVVKHS
jgi:cysteine desulfurase NifS/selenium donor protein